MNKGVAITGMGIISAIGNNVQENYNALLTANHGISRVENIETIQKNEIMVGEIKRTNEELISQLKLPSNNNYSRTAMLGVIAAKEAIANSGITNIEKYKTGIVSGTSFEGMKITKKNNNKNPTKKKPKNILKAIMQAILPRKLQNK